MEFALFATLPLGLFSLFMRGRGTHAGLSFLAALAPVVTSIFGGLVKRKGEQSAQQREIDYRRHQAEAQEAQNRAAWEAAQNSPRAAMQRLSFNTRLGQILGAFGGREQTPQFIQRAFDLARGPQQYTPGGGFIEPPKKGGSFWDYAGDIVGPGGAASYFDTERYRQGRQAAPEGASPAPAAAPTVAAPAAATGLLPSAIRQQFKLGPTPAADEFLRQRRPGG